MQYIPGLFGGIVLSFVLISTVQYIYIYMTYDKKSMM